MTKVRTKYGLLRVNFYSEPRTRAVVSAWMGLSFLHAKDAFAQHMVLAAGFVVMAAGFAFVLGFGFVMAARFALVLGFGLVMAARFVLIARFVDVARFVFVAPAGFLFVVAGDLN